MHVHWHNRCELQLITNVNCPVREWPPHSSAFS